MKVLVIVAAVALLGHGAFGQPLEPGASGHILGGPYDFDEHAKPQPRFFTLDDKPYYGIDQLKLAISQLPPGSRVHWAGSCLPSTAVELPPRPYMSLSAFRSYCAKHHVEFSWYFGR